MKTLSKRLLEVLKKTKRIKEADIQKALEICSRENQSKLQDVLVRMGLISEKELVSLVSMELKIPFLNLSKYKIDPIVGKCIPEKIARRHHVIPISKIGNKLMLAMADPFNILAFDDISILTKSKVECVISTEKDIEEALERLYSEEASDNMDTIAKTVNEEGDDVEVVQTDEDEEGLRIATDGSEAPIIKIVDLLLLEALKRRASDIHIEPFEKNVRVRYRVDGSLEEVLSIPKKNQNAVLTRLKIMSRLNITENRVPQDGRFKIKLQQKEVDFRVSVLPVQFGSKVVMRVLDKGAINFGLNHLGFSPTVLADFKEATQRPFGMILITGPTGSGKSTTLYSVLSELNTPDRNLITIEDPIEYQVRGITQIQARPEIGMDFANGLRAILRQSPDIVMVGEIRDSETADIAIKASLTGQLVLSTLHTNDAPGAITRLMDMGTEPFLIASSVIMVGGQRLCKRICQKCKTKANIPKETVEQLKIPRELLAKANGKLSFYKGKGCEKCNHTGYHGRLAIFESLLIDDPLRDLIVRRASAHEIKAYAVKHGMITLREDALRKLCEGQTTLDELVRVTSEEEEE